MYLKLFSLAPWTSFQSHYVPGGVHKHTLNLSCLICSLSYISGVQKCAFIEFLRAWLKFSRQRLRRLQVRSFILCSAACEKTRSCESVIEDLKIFVFVAIKTTPFGGWSKLEVVQQLRFFAQRDGKFLQGG